MLGTSREDQRVGPYRLLGRVASGGMATVYLAEQRGMHGFTREVAIKLLHRHLAEDPTFARELVEEARLASRIRHANVVQVLDVGEERGSVYLALEYVEGDSLAALLRAAAREGGRLPDPIVCRILLDAFAGLHAAHELVDDRGETVALVHRDFTPQNILVGVDGTTRLTDFGIARAASREGHTVTGTVKGKIAYLAPEQLAGRPIDRRADVFAAGVVAWEAFAGCRLYATNVEAEIMLKIVSERARSLRSVRADVPEALDRAIARALETQPDARTPDAATFAAELRGAVEGWSRIAEHGEVATSVTAACGATLGGRRAGVDVVPEMTPSSQRDVVRAVPSDAQTRDERLPGTTETATVTLVTPPRASRRVVVGGVLGAAALAAVVAVVGRSSATADTDARARPAIETTSIGARSAGAPPPPLVSSPAASIEAPPVPSTRAAATAGFPSQPTTARPPARAPERTNRRLPPNPYAP